MVHANPSNEEFSHGQEFYLAKQNAIKMLRALFPASSKKNFLQKSSRRILTINWESLTATSQSGVIRLDRPMQLNHLPARHYLLDVFFPTPELSVRGPSGIFLELSPFEVQRLYPSFNTLNFNHYYFNPYTLELLGSSRINIHGQEKDVLKKILLKLPAYGLIEGMEVIYRPAWPSHHALFSKNLLPLMEEVYFLESVDLSLDTATLRSQSNELVRNVSLRDLYLPYGHIKGHFVSEYFENRSGVVDQTKLLGINFYAQKNLYLKSLGHNSFLFEAHHNILPDLRSKRWRLMHCMQQLGLFFKPKL